MSKLIIYTNTLYTRDIPVQFISSDPNILQYDKTDENKQDAKKRYDDMRLEGKVLSTLSKQLVINIMFN